MYAKNHIFIFILTISTNLFSSLKLGSKKIIKGVESKELKDLKTSHSSSSSSRSQNLTPSNIVRFIELAKQNETKIIQIKLTIEPHLNINATDQEGFTPLMWAIKHKNLHVIKLLFRYKYLNVSKRNLEGESALMLAYESENEEIIKLILGHPNLKLDV